MIIIFYTCQESKLEKKFDATKQFIKILGLDVSFDVIPAHYLSKIINILLSTLTNSIDNESMFNPDNIPKKMPPESILKNKKF